METPIYPELWFLSGTKLSTFSAEDDPRSGRPISSTNDQNVEVVRAVMAKYRRLSVRMTAEETGLDRSAVRRILSDHLHMRESCAKLVRTVVGSASSNSSVRAVFSVHHGVVGRASSLYCWGVYKKWRVAGSNTVCISHPLCAWSTGG